MKMGFDAPAGKVDEQGRVHHLGGADGVSRDRLAGTENHQADGKRRDESAEEDGRPDVGVDVAFETFPGAGRNPQRHGNAGEPLEDQQHREHAVDLFPLRLLVLAAQLDSAVVDLTPDFRRDRQVLIHVALPYFSAFRQIPSEQP